MRSRFRICGNGSREGAVAGNESSPAFVTASCDGAGRFRTFRPQKNRGQTVTDVRDVSDYSKETDRESEGTQWCPTNREKTDKSASKTLERVHISAT